MKDSNYSMKSLSDGTRNDERFLNRKHRQIGNGMIVMGIIVNVWYGKMLTSLAGSIEVNLWDLFDILWSVCAHTNFFERYLMRSLNPLLVGSAVDFLRHHPIWHLFVRELHWSALQSHYPCHTTLSSD